MNNWNKLSLVEQMTNIGAEIQRAIKYKNLNDKEKTQGFVFHALKLLEMTINDKKNKNSLKEILRLKELIADYFFGNNVYKQNDEQLIKYFQIFEWALISKRLN